jgi:hypothetical protein
MCQPPLDRRRRKTRSRDFSDARAIARSNYSTLDTPNTLGACHPLRFGGVRGADGEREG